MTEKRTKAVKLGAIASFDVYGKELQVGDEAPDFALTANDWQMKSLADYAGKVKLVSVVPSLDTSVCDAQTRRFNQEATNLDSNIVVLTISADLPYAQKRWCGNAGIDRVITLSDHKDMNFAQAYGTFIQDLRVEQRSVFVIDQNNKIVHAEYVPEFGNEPDYNTALAATKKSITN